MKLYLFIAPLLVMTSLLGCSKTDKNPTAQTASTASTTNSSVTVASSTGTVAANVADMSPTDHKDAREKIMKQWGKANKTMGAMIKDPSTFNAAEFKAAAAKLDQDPWRHFTADAKGGEAKDAVWTDAATFQQQIDKYKTNVSALITATQTATSAQMVKQQQADVSASCKSCHEKFKKD